MAKFTKAELSVLKRITPPAKQPAIVAQVLEKVSAALKRMQVLATVRLGGSLAKGTYLKGDHDVDVFVRFSPDYADAELAGLLEQVLTGTFTHVDRVHGSRDYFHIRQGSFMFEFIPVLHISSWEEAVNVTDMSPLHVDYVRQHIDADPELAKSIRLTKQFCKAAKVYGAESYIGGLSGHVVDLLCIHYSGFHQLLAAAAQWPAKVIIDPEGHHDNPMVALNDAKTTAPLVIVDPIQPDRNSAAALSPEAFRKFKQHAAAYLAAAPAEQERFFTVRPLDIAGFRQEHHADEVVVVELVPHEGKKDVVGAKCMKVYEHLYRELLAHGFRPLASKWEFAPEQAVLLFAFPAGLLPEHEEHQGPPVHKTVDVVRFKAAHEMTFTRDGRLFAVERRKYRNAKKLIEHLLKDGYVAQRVQHASMSG